MQVRELLKFRLCDAGLAPDYDTASCMVKEASLQWSLFVRVPDLHPRSSRRFSPSLPHPTAMHIRCTQTPSATAWLLSCHRGYTVPCRSTTSLRENGDSVTLRASEDRSTPCFIVVSLASPTLRRAGRHSQDLIAAASGLASALGRVREATTAEGKAASQDAVHRAEQRAHRVAGVAVKSLGMDAYSGASVTFASGPAPAVHR